MTVTKEYLIEFENDIAKEFNNAQIKAPVHLSDGNEDNLIKFFSDWEIGESDWVLGSWRSHYHCLLKGVPPQLLKAAILQGRSISLCFEKYKVLCSGIVGGCIPIALGIAVDIKRENIPGRVFCFIGDMTSETGVAHEAIKYAVNYDLPIHFIIEDNGKSVCTDTRETWGNPVLFYESASRFSSINSGNRVCAEGKVTYYKYTFAKYPHAGAGQRVQF